MPNIQQVNIQLIPVGSGSVLKDIWFHLHVCQACPALGVLEQACWVLFAVIDSSTSVGLAGEYATILLLRAEEQFSSSPVLELMNQGQLKKRGLTFCHGTESRHKSLPEQFCPELARLECFRIHSFVLLQGVFQYCCTLSKHFFEHLPRTQSCAMHVQKKQVALSLHLVLLKR